MEKLGSRLQIEPKPCKAPLYLPGGHLQTIVPSFRRFKTKTPYLRERLVTDDDDFLDLDWLKTGHKKLVVLSHGLEGSSRRPYMVGMAHKLSGEYDVLAWNFRSCSGEINNKLRFYHSGAVDDLERVIAHARRQGYDEIALTGFSMGGNISLLYISGKPDNAVKAAILFSVPCDLAGSARKLASPVNRIYMIRFMKMLRAKIIRKKEIFPELDTTGIDKIKTFREFDDRYTAPIHGFRDAEDYWAKCSSAAYIEHIKRPTLIVNAANDPFLSPGCYPYGQAGSNPCVRLLVPQSGGHVGFPQKANSYWSEELTYHFLREAF